MNDYLYINEDTCNLCGVCQQVCPFNAIKVDSEKVTVNENCRLCGICVKACPQSAITMNVKKKIQDLSKWQGILTVVEWVNGKIHPVTQELIGKALELGKTSHQSVYCIAIGYQITDKVKRLESYGMNKIFVYDHINLEHFKSDLYADVLEHCIKQINPSIVLAAALPVSRSFVPRVAAKVFSGMTADCTSLYMDKDNLIQTRPAFGGNIMAEIITESHRPQFATIRYGTMKPAKQENNSVTPIEIVDISSLLLESNIKILEIEHYQQDADLANAEVVLAIGRGVKSKKDIEIFQKVAQLLNAKLCSSRALVEKGWMPQSTQIGLSGQSISPKLLITLGISGSVQFLAGIKNSKEIIAINTDKESPIFEIADYSILNDMYEVIPYITGRINNK